VAANPTRRFDESGTGRAGAGHARTIALCMYAMGALPPA
jgi:hypothetical protein